jgi:hypothetical protein
MLSMRPLWLAGALVLLTSSVTFADPPWTSYDKPGNGPPPWANANFQRVQSVPVPDTAIAFGLGFIALIWFTFRLNAQPRHDS